MLRAWSTFGCLAIVAVLAASPDSMPSPLSTTAVPVTVDPDSTRRDSTATQRTAAAAAADRPEDLAGALRTLQALHPDLAAAQRTVFDELVAAAGEMAANGDTAAARLLIGDARRWLAPQEKP